MCVGLPAVAALVGCTVSVSVHSVDDNQYKTTWTSGWEATINDAVPWNSTGSTTGVCDKGGKKQGCFDTDQKVTPDLQSLLDGLAVAKVPSDFSEATTTLRQAITLNIQGLKDRDAAIAGNDDTLFSQGADELARASRLFALGYSQFPDYDRPTPPPFGGEGHQSS
ncbi:MAG: hypothetical protein JWQ81_5966 [Amycolatopsis sp.]|jgi:hypothetical protein|nr:hypothetical protein [Amycolatopsis sp.]